MITREYKCLYYHYLKVERNDEGDFKDPVRENEPTGKGTVIGFLYDSSSYGSQRSYIVVDENGITLFLSTRDVKILL